MTYELMLVLPPDLTEEELKLIIEEVKKLIVAGGGEVVKEDAWGKRVLAYPIKKFKEGVYHFFNFKMGSSEVTTLEKKLNLQDGLLRFLIVKCD